MALGFVLELWVDERQHGLADHLIQIGFEDAFELIVSILNGPGTIENPDAFVGRVQQPLEFLLAARIGGGVLFGETTRFTEGADQVTGQKAVQEDEYLSQYYLL